MRAGKSSDKELPLRFIMHQWRRMMRASYQEMLDTPIDVIFADLEYIEIERAFTPND